MGLGAWLTYAYMPPRETLCVVSSQSNFKVLTARVVLAHLHATFSPCTYGLHRGTAAVTAVLIGYDDVEVAAGTTTQRRRSWTTTSPTPTRDYVGSLPQLFFRCSARLVVTTIYDPFIFKFPGCNGRCSASAAYPSPYSGIRAVLHSFFGLDLLLHNFDWINWGWKEVEVDCVMWLNG
jgi:hypothetical protein